MYSEYAGIGNRPSPRYHGHPASSVGHPVVGTRVARPSPLRWGPSMIRPTVRDDVPRLLELTAGTGLFMRYDLDTLEGVLDDYFSDPDANAGEEHACVTCEEAGTIVGFAYYAATEYADRTWFVWWIAVEKGTQGRG